MRSTELLYLADSRVRRCEARVIGVETRPTCWHVILDRTPAYPRGGGQPGDSGTMVSGGLTWTFDTVIKTDVGEVVHQGPPESPCPFLQGYVVTVEVDDLVRQRHSRLHTAGEAICAAVERLGYDWPVTAATHVPGQARVALSANLQAEVLPAFTQSLAHELEALIAADYPVETVLLQSLEAAAAFGNGAVEAGKATWPLRMVSPAPGFWRPCLGAHCSTLRDVEAVMLRKVRLKGRDLSISYTVSGVD